MKFVFVDTNIFIQCKSIHELPFNDLFPETKIQLLIPRGVIKELDDFKSQGNTRRAKRAKAAIKLINKIPIGDFYEINNYLSLGLTSKKQLSAHPKQQGLDLDKVDDSIIQDIIAYTALTKKEVSLITNDGLLITTAKEYDCDFNEIPESWLLAPETSTHEKQIKALEEKIKALESQSPKVDVQCFEGEHTITKLHLTLKSYPPLCNEELNNLVKIFTDKSPMHPKENMDNIFPEIKPPVDTKAQLKYENQDYPEWVERISILIKHLPNYLNHRNNLRTLGFGINNNGSVPAENTLIRLEVSESFNFQSPKTILWEFPKAPKPKPLTASVELRQDRDFLLKPTRRDLVKKDLDKPTFYWKDKMHENHANLWELECEEFRHKHESQPIWLDLKPVDSNHHKSGEIKCTVSAKNIAEPVEFKIPIIVSSEPQDSYLECKKFIESADSPPRKASLLSLKDIGKIGKLSI